MSSEMVSWLRFTVAPILACCVVYGQIRLIVCWLEVRKLNRLVKWLDRCWRPGERPDELNALSHEIKRLRFDGHRTLLSRAILRMIVELAQKEEVFTRIPDLLTICDLVPDSERAEYQILEHAISIDPRRTYEHYRSRLTCSNYLMSKLVRTVAEKCQPEGLPSFWRAMRDHGDVPGNVWSAAALFEAWHKAEDIKTIRGLAEAAHEIKCTDWYGQAVGKWLNLCASAADYAEWYCYVMQTWVDYKISQEALDNWNAQAERELSDQVNSDFDYPSRLRDWILTYLLPNSPKEGRVIQEAAQYLADQPASSE